MKRITAILLTLLLIVSSLPAFAANESRFIIGMVYEKSATINPIYCNQRDLQSLNELVFESMITFDETLKPVGELALSWEVDDSDSRVLNVRLRENARFHDGTYMCAQDVYESWRYIINLGSSYPYYARCSYIDSISVTGDFTLKIKGKSSSYYTLYAMTFPVLQRNSLGLNLAIGTGPYWYMYNDVDWIQVDANPYWWKKAPTVDSVYVFRYDETGEALQALNTGEVDALPTRSQNAALGRLLSDRISVDYSTLTYEMLIPNLSKDIFRDVRTRQAIMYALEMSEISANIYMDMVTESEVPVVTGSWLYEPQSAIYFESKERALMLLNEAGWGDFNDDGIRDRVIDGMLVEMKFTITTCDDDAANTHTHAAQLIADQLAILGIQVTVKTVSASKLQQALKKKDFEMVLCGVNLSVVPDLTFLLKSDGRMNYSGYADSEMDAMLERLKTTTDEEEFKTIFKSMERKIAEELPFMGLFFRKGTIMTTADVDGLDAVLEGDVLRGFEYIHFN